MYDAIAVRMFDDFVSSEKCTNMIYELTDLVQNFRVNSCRCAAILPSSDHIWTPKVNIYIKLNIYGHEVGIDRLHLVIYEELYNCVFAGAPQDEHFIMRCEFHDFIVLYFNDFRMQIEDLYTKLCTRYLAFRLDVVTTNEYKRELTKSAEFILNHEFKNAVKELSKHVDNNTFREILDNALCNTIMEG